MLLPHLACSVATAYYLEARYTKSGMIDASGTHGDVLSSWALNRRRILNISPMDMA